MIRTEPLWQTGLLALCAGLTIGLYVIGKPSLEHQILLLAPLIALFGLPHGALDLPIGETLWSMTGWRGKLAFLAVYLALVASVIGLWLLAPALGLVGFLGYSALHFSDDWARAAPPLRWTGGAATIGAPALFHRPEVEALFGALAPPAAAAFSAALLAIAGGLALVALIATLILTPRARGQAAAEQAMLWATALVLPPLVYFAVYFCALHSMRHFTATIRRAPRARRALAVAAALSALVTLGALGIVRIGVGQDLGRLPDLALQVIFIGLAALTVPHMILVARFHRQPPEAAG